MNEKNRPQSVERSNDVTLLDITQILRIQQPHQCCAGNHQQQ